MYVDAIYCEICELWLNGATQWENHTIRKKHKKNLKRVEMGLPKIPFRRKRKADKTDKDVNQNMLSSYQRAQLRARL